ncbi:MAG: lipocalin-like domain-containing protein [Syntrophobacteraceae bacterium]
MFVLLLSGSLPALTLADFRKVSGPCHFQFPADHASHPEYRTEWWYYTGNLQSDDGERFGFQLTFFRVGTQPASSASSVHEKRSAWRSDQIFAAHAAVTDLSRRRFHSSEKMARGALGLAGAISKEEGGIVVFLSDWRVEIDGDKHRVFARVPEFTIELELAAAKPPVSHGERGYSRKGESEEEASCYYSITRLHAEGRISAGGREKAVSGNAWMDHEFSSASIGPRVSGWDWFSIQLSDGSEVMVYLIREKNGGTSPVSSGTYIDPNGNARRLSMEDLRVKVLDTWKSPSTGATYPSSWLLDVVPTGMRLEIMPKLADQEVQTPESTRITYWEGTVSVKGTSNRGLPVEGEGYVELTGYAGPVRY